MPSISVLNGHGQVDVTVTANVVHLSLDSAGNQRAALMRLGQVEYLIRTNGTVANSLLCLVRYQCGVGLEGRYGDCVSMDFGAGCRRVFVDSIEFAKACGIQA